MKYDAHILSGLPGSGKSTAAQILSDMTGGEILHAGDMVRQMARDDGHEDLSSHELGEYAASLREEYGGGVIGQRIAGLLLRDEVAISEPAIVDAVRHKRGLTELREYFTNPRTLYIQSPFQVRLSRLQDRARDGEAEFTAYDLMERDSREMDGLGLSTIHNDAGDSVDQIIYNDRSRQYLKEQLQV